MCNFCRWVADVAPRETSLSGDERGETSAIRRLLLKKLETSRSALHYARKWSSELNALSCLNSLENWSAMSGTVLSDCKLDFSSWAYLARGKISKNFWQPDAILVIPTPCKMYPKYGKNNHVRNNCVKIVWIGSIEFDGNFGRFCPVWYARSNTRDGRLARNAGWISFLDNVLWGTLV